MKIEIQAPWQVNEQFQELINNRVEKFTTFYDRIIHVDVFLNLKEHSIPNDKGVEIKVKLPGVILFAESHAENHEKALAQASEKIKTQLVKRKERLSQY